MTSQPDPTPRTPELEELAVSAGHLAAVSDELEAARLAYSAKLAAHAAAVERHDRALTAYSRTLPEPAAVSEVP